MKKNFKTIAFYVIAIIALIGVTNWLFGNTKKEEVTYSDVREYFVNEQVTSFEVTNSNDLVLTLKDSEEEIVYKLHGSAISIKQS